MKNPKYSEKMHEFHALIPVDMDKRITQVVKDHKILKTKTQFVIEAIELLLQAHRG